MVSLTDTETVKCSKLYKRYMQIYSAWSPVSTMMEIMLVEMRSLLSWTSHDRTKIGQIHSHTKVRGFYCMCTHMNIQQHFCCALLHTPPTSHHQLQQYRPHGQDRLCIKIPRTAQPKHLVKCRQTCIICMHIVCTLASLFTLHNKYTY